MLRTFQTTMMVMLGVTMGLIPLIFMIGNGTITIDYSYEQENILLEKQIDSCKQSLNNYVCPEVKCSDSSIGSTIFGTIYMILGFVFLAITYYKYEKKSKSKQKDKK